MRTTASLVSLTANIEAGQIAINGKACRLELIGHGSDLPLGHLGLQRLQQDRDGSLGAGEICCVSSATLMPLKY
jgi:hypothetical protein